MELMFIDSLRKLLQFNEEPDTPTEKPSMESQNDPRNFQPWREPEGLVPYEAPRAVDSQIETESDDEPLQPAKKKRRGFLFGRRKAAEPTTPKAQGPSMNQRPGMQRQPMPQRQHQQRTMQLPQIQSPQTRQPPKMVPQQGAHNPNWHGQPWTRGYPGGMGQPGMRPQGQMFNEWGLPVPSARRQGFFGPPSPTRMTSYPPQRRPSGAPIYPRIQGPRVRRQPPGPWL
jgi:hypothetical protein